MKKTLICKTLISAALVSGACVSNLHAQSADALVNKLVEKGILTDKEAKGLITEASQTNHLAGASKWKINDAIKNINLYGDVRFRYEYRSAENPAPGNAYYRERFRYALRLGVRGDLFDNFYYGLRVETSKNPRSPWNTFADDTGGTAPGAAPADKNSDGVNIGQVYLGWKPTDWYEMTVGRMPMPLYVTPMIWDSDINPEGAVEKFKLALHDVDLFANFGQFIYQDTNPDQQLPSSDTFLLAWQVGANAKLAKDISLKVAPVLYTYTGQGVSAGLNTAYTGQGVGGLNPDNSLQSNQNGINDLTVLEVPAELNFKLGRYGARVFGDFAYNFEGDDRARAAFTGTKGGVAPLPHPFTGEDKAYQFGLGLGNLGLVYGQTSKKNTWEARAYWQHVEQYAADVNLLDSDVFEGRANLQGFYAAFAYSFTDNIIGTVRYGYATRINNNLGTGGNNPDLSGFNPIRNYHLLQLDLTWRF
ncbi:MAG: putative porin [Verrucomicrobiota bacterium]|jgi:polyhydroxyalkanoate synthesis regulator phasin